MSRLHDALARVSRLFRWIRGSGSAWESGWVVAEGEEGEGDEGSVTATRLLGHVIKRKTVWEGARQGSSDKYRGQCRRDTRAGEVLGACDGGGGSVDRVAEGTL
jgi:hypothetical protein